MTKFQRLVLMSLSWLIRERMSQMRSSDDKHDEAIHLVLAIEREVNSSRGRDTNVK